MATFRVGVGSFNIKDGAVGFGTDTDGLGNLKVKGVTKTTDIKVSGASTLTRYSGFAADNNSQLENVTLTSEVGTIGDIVVGVGTSVIISSASTVTVGTVESVSIGTHFSPPKGGIEERGQDFVEGMMRFNTDLNTMEFYNGNEWRQFTYILDIKNSPSSSGRAVLGGGRISQPTQTDDIQSYNIHTLGNATNFGSLSSSRQGVAGFGSRIRAIYGGGLTPSYVNTIDYGDFQSGGTVIDFGNMTTALAYRSGASSSTRGIFSTGYTGSANTNAIDYIQISTIGDAVDFGDAIVANRSAKALASPTRFVQAGGYTSEYHKGMEFLTISSLGNTVSFGDLSNRVFGAEGISNNVRGIFAAGRIQTGHFINAIDSIIISSTGSTEHFGDLINTTTHSVGSSSNTRGVFCGGYTGTSPYTYVEVMSFITLNSAGNSIDFGNLSPGTDMAGGTSDCHGGLGGY